MQKMGKCYVVLRKSAKLLLLFLLIFLLNQVAEGSQEVLFLDDLGRVVVLPRPAVRIVSLSDAHAENLIALRAVKQIVAVGESADPKWIPKQVERITRPPEIEKMRALRADLVLVDELWASENSAFMGALSASELPFAVFARPQFDSFGAYLLRFGRFTGRTRDAEQAYASMSKALQKTEVRSGKTDDPSVLIVAGVDYATSPKDSWSEHIVRAAGGNPLVKDGLQQTPDSPWFVSYGQDEILAAMQDADVIFTLRSTMRSVADLSRDDILNDPKMQTVKAVKNGRVWEIDAQALMLPSLVRLDASLKECWGLIRRTSK